MCFKILIWVGADGRDEPFRIEGQMYNYENKDAITNSRNSRQTFISLINQIVRCDEKDDRDFMEYRKELSNTFKRFFTFYKKHVKKRNSNDTTVEILKTVLKPLEDVLDCNMRLTLVDFQFKDLDTFDVNNFKYKALITNFCTTYQNLQGLLLTHNKWRDLKENNEQKRKEGKENEIVTETKEELIYSSNPDVYSVLKKLQYSSWKDNKVERFFIQKLQDAFMMMRVNMSKLYSMGFEYWRTPISMNEQLIADIKHLIDLEDRLEIILGDRRKREQLNFMYDVLKVIFNGLSKKKLLEKSMKLMNLSIPRLVALKSLIKIHEVFQKKYKEVSEGEDIKEHEIEPPKPLIDFALMSALNPKQVKTHQGLLPPGHVYEETIELANDQSYTVRMDDNNLDELDKYGRFFMWPDYVPEEMYEEICENAKMLRDINLAVLHDLEDYIIVQGMEASDLDMKRNRGKSSRVNVFLNREGLEGK